MNRINNSNTTSRLKDKRKISEQRPTYKSKTINERFPNDNIYKNDIRYQMNTSLKFESTLDEENANKEFCDRYQIFVKLAVSFGFMKFVYSLLINSNYILFIFFFLTSVICIFLVFKKSNKEKLFPHISPANSNSILANLNIGTLVKILLQITQIVSLIFSRDSNFEFSLGKYVYSIMPNILINIPVDSSFTPYVSFCLLIGVLLIYKDESVIYSELTPFKKLFTGLFSYRFLLIIIVIVGNTLIQYYYKKGTRELWALFDSFKRSYFTIKKCLYDDFPYPVFIFNKKTNNHSIFYKNCKAEELINRIKKIKEGGNSQVGSSINPNSSVPSIKKVVPLGKSNVGFSRRNVQKAGLGLRKEELIEELFLDKDFESVFESELEKCVNNKKKFFDFPLRVEIIKKTDSNINNNNDNLQLGKINFHQSSKNSLFFEGDLEYYEWYRVVVSQCYWKNQEAYYVQMIKNDDFYKNYFASNFMRSIRGEFNQVIENVDKVCDKLVEAESPQQHRERNINLNPSASVNTKSRLSETNAGFIFRGSPPEKPTPDSTTSATTMPLNRRPLLKKQQTLIPPSHVKNFQLNLTGAPGSVNSSSAALSSGINNVFTSTLPNYDFSIWLYFKYNIGFLFDTCLTLKAYNSLMNKRLHTYDYKISIKEMIEYFSDYFLIPLRIKNLKLIFHNYSNEDELVVNYTYFRTVFFNIILFIINNVNIEKEDTLKKGYDGLNTNISSNSLNYQTNNYFYNSTNNLISSLSKVIEVNIRSEKEISSEDYKIKFTIKYKDEKPKIEYADINSLLNSKNKCVDMNFKNLNRINVLDLGLISIYHILNRVYDNELLISSENSIHTLSFYLKGKFQKESLIPVGSTKNITTILLNENYPTFKFREPHSKVFEEYYDKILQKIYKIFPPNINKILDTKEKICIIESNKNFKGNFFSVCGEEFKYDMIDGVESDATAEKLLPQEIDVKISQDMNLVNEVNINLNKHFESYDNLPELINLQSKEAIEKIKNDSKNLKYMRYKPSICKSVSSNKIRFEEDCRSNLKYFYPPRFLIVEDNAFGRINLIDILKKQKLDYLIDIAAYGWESIQKFKYFLNKGYIYDIIFMDINLLDMLGSEAARIMREYERECTGHHTNIVAVSVEGKKNIMSDTTFDSYCNNYFIINYILVEKPIKGEEFTEYITKHFQKNRPDIKI